jgi:AbrB family looped-hinge helix DNA binding protein
LEIDGKGRVLIPAEKRRGYGIEEGDEVEIAVLGSQ